MIIGIFTDEGHRTCNNAIRIKWFHAREQEHGFILDDFSYLFLLDYLSALRVLFY